MNNHRLLHNDIITDFFFFFCKIVSGIRIKLCQYDEISLLKTWFLLIRLHPRHHPLRECQLPLGGAHRHLLAR